MTVLPTTTRTAVPVEPLTAEPRVKTVGDVLRHAALMIEESGWIQDGYGDADTGYCLVGSIAVAADGSTSDWAEAKVDVRQSHPMRVTYDAALDAVRDYLGKHPERFNDEHGRTAAEVVAALRAAADAADNGR